MIKKHYLLMAIYTLMAGMTFAQSNKFEAGIEGGPSLLFMKTGGSNQNNRIAVGPTIGAFFQYNINEHIAIHTNLFYERKGMDREVYSPYYSMITTYKYRYDYMTLPILFRVTLGKKIRYFANIGPYLGCLLNQTTSLYFTNNDYYSSSNTAAYNRLDFGLSGGLGFAVPLNQSIALSFEARDNFGLIDINSGTAKHNTINLLVGVAYKFGSK